MNDIILKIDGLMDSISADTTKSQLPDLSRQIVELSKIFGCAKRDYIQAKNKYDNELVMKKESWKIHLEMLENKKFEDDPKYKKAKISNVEAETQAELELISLGVKQAIETPQLIMVYLEPLIRSYMDWIMSVKFTSKENKDQERFNQ